MVPISYQSLFRSRRVLFYLNRTRITFQSMIQIMRLVPEGKINIMKRNTVTCIRKTEKPFTITDMPHPKSLPLFGTKLSLIAAGNGIRLHEYIDRRHKKLGTIFYEKLGGSNRLVFISDPNLMKSLFLNIEGKYPMHILPDPWVLYEKIYGNKRGLFFMNGEEWLNNRRVMNKYLLRDDAEKWMKSPVQETVAKLIESWKNRAISELFVPHLETEFYRLSTDVIISILLGHDSMRKSSKHSENLLDLFSESVKKIFQTTTKLYGLPIKWYQKLNLKEWRNFKESVDMSLLLAQKIVRELLLNRQANKGLIKRLCDENLSEETITRIVADFVIAAGDTTAYTSLWIIFLLSNNSKVVNDMRNRNQDFVKYVVRETMRLYPVAPFLTRILPKDDILGHFKLNVGTPVIASIYTSGRDENNFSQAGRFLPYRWDRSDPRRESLKNHVSSASLPFALGARSCIGKKIAMLQMNELFYQIVNNFDLKCLNETEVKPITSQVLVPDRDVRVAISLRK